ncbi:hypothetical protein GCM10012320_12470 [Sinomonas cellulolyticus]|nr:hypothetical protein GCM10012320_12470 [Sinomonas sp. KCTC 49339]
MEWARGRGSVADVEEIETTGRDTVVGQCRVVFSETPAHCPIRIGVPACPVVISRNGGRGPPGEHRENLNCLLIDEAPAGEDCVVKMR